MKYYTTCVNLKYYVVKIVLAQGPNITVVDDEKISYGKGLAVQPSYIVVTNDAPFTIGQ